MIEIEEEMSHAAADVIFRTLFSIPIEHDVASAVFREFQTYQRTQPLLNIGAFLPLPRWFPRMHRRATLRSAAKIRALITDMTTARAAETLAAAQKRESFEGEKRAKLASGVLGLDMYNMRPGLEKAGLRYID